MSSKVLLLVAFCSSVGMHGADVPGHQLSAIQRPVSFEPNLGQVESSARFLTRGAGYSARISEGRTEFQLGKRTVTMDLLNANHDVEIHGTSPLPGTVNYFAGSDKAKWHANIPTYSRVDERGVYPGVDLTFYGNEKKLEYDFIVHAGADPERISLKVSGFDKARLGESGDLVLALGEQEFRLMKPVAYQLGKDGRTREKVEATYRFTTGVMKFSLGQYDRSRPLVIDPVLTYSESLDSYANALAVGVSSGNTYTVSGTEFNGPMHVTKFGPTGAVIYDTAVGVSGLLASGIAVDGTGKAYITGVAGSGAGLPTGSNSYQATPPPDPYSAAFLVVVSANGSAIPYATYLTGSSGASGTSVAADGNGFAYIAGQANGPDFPTTPGVYKDPAGVGQAPGFVAKFNPAAIGGASLVYSLVIGAPNGYNHIQAIAADPLGDVYLTGVFPTGYPVTTGAFTYNGYASGSGGVYVTKLNPTASALLYSAYLGDGVGYSIAVDKEYNAYVTGTVSFGDFPTTTGAYQTDYPGGFVTKLNPAGSAEVFSTFLGGPSSYLANVLPLSVAITPGCPATSPTAIPCNVYVGGWTGAKDYPTVNAIQNYLSDSSAFVTELTPNGESALFSTYLSGAGSGIEYDLLESNGTSPVIAVDGSGNITMLANENAASNFPLSIASSRSGLGFLARISPASTASLFTAPAAVNFGTQPVGLSTHQYGGTATVQVMNLSDVAAPISGIQITPAAFSESNNCGSSIAPGSYCSFNVDFMPSAAGAFSGKITVTSSALAAPESISLAGAGQDEGFLVTSVASLTFPTEFTEQSSSPQSVTVINAGTLSSGLSISNSSSNFSELNNCPAILAAKASCIVSVTFNPSQAGLQTDSLLIKTSSGPNPTVALSGTAETPLANEAVTLSAGALTFVPQTVGTAAINEEAVSITNTGNDPVTLSSVTASGDFQTGASQCHYPFQLNPQQSCTVYLTFAPTTSGTRTGTLSFNDTALGSPQTVSLAGTGVASTDTLEFYPSAALLFPDQVVGTASGAQVIDLINTGSATLPIDRVLAAGDYKISSDSCTGRVVPGTTQDGALSYNTCQVEVQFTPTSAGARTGTVTFVDSSTGVPHVIQLTGNGVAGSGTLTLDTASLDFATQALGTTGATQTVTLENPGNTPLKVTSVSTSNLDFSVSAQTCPLVQFSIAPLSSCTVAVAFNPTSTGVRSGKLNIVSGAGTAAVTLGGTGVAETKTLQFTPSNSMNFGSGPQTIFVQNSGSAAISFWTAPTISGPNASDFNIDVNTCGQSGSLLPPGASCYVELQFISTATTQQTATITFTDTASGGTQNITLTGTGGASGVSLSNESVTFVQQIEGTTSAPTTSVTLSNYSNTPKVLGTVAVTGNFLLTHGKDGCSGQTLFFGGSCQVYVQFAPSLASPAANALSTGTLVFVDAGQTVLATAALSGYGLAPTVGAYLTPASLVFDTPQVLTTTSWYLSAQLSNTGNTPLTVGSPTGTNLGPKSASSEFGRISDSCANQTIQPGTSCQVFLDFTPYTAGTRTGSISYPVTYANQTKATLSASLQGQGIAEKDSALLSPASGSFADQTVGLTTTYNVSAYLTNEGNQPFSVGTLTGVNTIVGSSVTGEFSTKAASGGSDACSQTTVQPGSSCKVVVAFTPSAAGQRSGSITFPVAYADKTTASLTLSLTGKGIAQVKTIQISTGNSMYFGEVVQGTQSGDAIINVSNTGNTPLSLGASSITAGNADFSVASDGCLSITLPATQSCYIELVFNPSSSSPTGTRKGMFTLADNASGGPHQVQLSGVSVSKQQPLLFSTTNLNFSDQAVSTTSPAQLVYITNRSNLPVSITSFTLVGPNASDYELIAAPCVGVLGPQTSCAFPVSFNPSAVGSRVATIDEADNSSSNGHQILLTGNGVQGLPQISFLPGTLTFPLQDVGTESAGQTFSITNTGAAVLKISNVTSTNASEFPITSDNCVGRSFTPGQQCVVTVAFSPKLGGTRSGGLQVSSNTAVKTLSVSGLALGIPKAAPSVSSLSYGNQNTGSTSAEQTVTLTNTGTDTLDIASIAIGGTNAADYSIQAQNCESTLAPSTSCSVGVTFHPSAAGTRVAALTFTDNANNATGSTQSVSLSGTGVSAPQAAVSPSSLTFAVTPVGSATAAQTVTVSNGGAGALAIASIKLGGTNPGDFATSTTCGSSLAAGGSCTVSVSFKPLTSGSRAATLTVTDNANNVAGSTQNVALSGTGEVAPEASVSPTSLSFPATATGVASAAKTVTLSNPGTAPLNVTSIASGGTDASDFVVTNNCAGSVAAGGSCTISVVFQPTGNGVRSGAVVVTDDAGYVTGAKQTVVLSGTGT